MNVCSPGAFVLWPWILRNCQVPYSGNIFLQQCQEVCIPGMRGEVCCSFAQAGINSEKLARYSTW
jgi:hypothetical protein